jgi:TonB family protein
MVSSLVVGMVFVTAVVVSIYAADIGLGNSSFELVEMIAPPDLAPIKPESQQPQSTSQVQSDIPTRKMVIDRLDDSRLIPDKISTVPNAAMERPRVPYRIDVADTNPSGGGREISSVGPTSPGLVASGPQVGDKEPEPEPPPLAKPIDKKPVAQSLGVINGRAESLPKPIYSAAALAVRAQGKVDVQVTIDESGRVISANAVSGHPLLKPAAEQAAKSARFSPTLLSKVPVKVTGVIVYNFTR